VVSAVADEASLPELCRHTVQLVAELPAPLRRVRVSAGELSVELEWSGPESPGAGAREPVPAPAEPTADPADRPPGSYAVRSPMVGTFYRSREPGARPFVEVGQEVSAGTEVGIVEAMKLMNVIQADRTGRILQVLVADGAPVEYDQPLVLLADAETRD